MKKKNLKELINEVDKEFKKWDAVPCATNKEGVKLCQIM
jgi:hypothetical protein